MITNRNLEDWTFDDLSKYVVRTMMDSLFTGGGRGMNTAFFGIFTVICDWQETQLKKKKEV
jgi:hypothetical protein